MKENLYQAERINSLKIIHSHIEDHSVPFLQMNASGFETGWLPCDGPKVPQWRLAGGMVNSLTKTAE